jgi:hypothetical protein
MEESRLEDFMAKDALLPLMDILKVLTPGHR